MTPDDPTPFEADTAEEPVEPERSASGKARARRWAVGLSAAAISVAVLAGVLWAAVALDVLDASPACAQCHAFQAGALAKDAHAQGATSCYDCHADPDPISRSARMARDVTAVFRLGEVREASVSNSACRVCHGKMEKVVEVRGLRMSHLTCLSADMRCTDCHSGVAHGVPAPGRGIDMDACSRCHDGDRAPSRCEVCHLGKREALREDSAAWRVTHGKNWRTTHGMGDLRTCTLCHDTADCSRCHMPVPHGESWPAEHGATVLKVGRDKCTGCHVRQLCDGCHGITMPHPGTWLASHAASTTKEQEKGMCRSCHSEADCTECHEMHVHPGIPADVLERMLGR